MVQRGVQMPSTAALTRHREIDLLQFSGSSTNHVEYCIYFGLASHQTYFAIESSCSPDNIGTGNALSVAVQ
jgi:hypothetical protein